MIILGDTKMKRLLFSIAMMLVLGLPSTAQSVERKGNNFTQVSKAGGKGGKETKTQYTYTDSKGTIYYVYLSSSGKAFIKKVSKKTGKEYRQYMPEIGKQINPKAYQEKK